ncbi:hypothetical protein [Clostridium sporogenes]|uniref:hypothetical protein n=1 Tax=Clostridium sporogenes TaxID=1509 RepID=UPI00024BA08E|nr:hypothetical protein [Clostridium sporogenes]EHN13942.1 pseudaminic acid biosynthesis protein PseA [Clostridium sporogenes PA 3679]KYN77476.1 hypothetical protein A0J52_11565 [Clostridium sporogenes]MCW6107415.1 hypothetical protein [Clostridium sporogenes]MDU4598206.1 hypothetical protein [Clostridium sporogenes]NFF67585.1 hypothetical protein [Clostridium sporogenes]
MGENSQNEYGGPAAASENNVLDRRWLIEFWRLWELKVTDFIGVDGIEKRHIIPYVYPTDDKIKKIGVTGLFLGYYIPRAGYTNVLIAENNGFTTYSRTVEGSIVDYENSDNY